MKEMQCISSESLSNWGLISLKKSGLTDEDAHIVVRGLIQTSLWGIDSHGIARLPHYLGRLKAGSLNPVPQLKTEHTGPCSANVHGDDGLGIVVVDFATREAIHLAKKNGIGCVGVRESSHCGAIGIYGRAIADAGLIGLVFTHSDAFVAPHRGYQKFVGTNPVCICVPNDDGPPVCLDMATSAIAWNKVMNARNENHNIPDDVAFDRNGDPTENPHAVACLQPMATYKGYALAFMIDLLCGPLNGMPWGLNIPAMYGDLSEKRHLGSLVIAIDPLRFFGGVNFPRSVADMVKAARSQPVKDPDQPVLAPGDDHYANEKRRLIDGIPVEPALLKEFAAWSIQLDIPTPQYISTAIL